MRLESLRLVDFRNFDRLQVSLRPRLNFFLGENGQGKTNFIEAVHLLSRGISFRPADSQNLIRTGASRGKIDGRFTRGDFTYDVEMLLEAGRKTAWVNGKRANSATLLKTFPSVLFSPESLSAIKEGPDERRQLIDEILISHDPKQGSLLREYSRALKSRNKLLRNLADNEGPRPETLASLESLNKLYFIMATHLTAARIKALGDMVSGLSDAMKFISDDSVGDISVDYVISDESALRWSESQIFDALRKRHQELALSEMNYGGSLVGPHKHDIKFLLGGNDSRFYSSQGQQRALILALKIAQIVYHHQVHQNYPVLLLDDVLSELDSKKRFNLMKFLEGISAQILITSTDLAWSDQFGFDRNSVFNVTQGRVDRTALL
ncbi:MAG: DNA replication and repair protein RecF [Bdellovibrionota bacterium]